MDIKITAENVINALFNPQEIVNLRIISDRKDTAFQGMKMSVEAGKYKTIEEQLIQHNKQNRCISFVVNSGGAKDSEINKINSCFVECDSDSFEVQKQRIDAFKLKPSMIIKTRKSLHTYWFTKDVPVAAFRPIQKALVETFNGDPNCVNEARCLRLPGFYHCKEEPIEVVCIQFNPEFRYTVTDFTDALPNIKFDAQQVKTEPTKLGTEVGLSIVATECDFIKHCKNDAKTLSEHDWYAMISNLAIFEGGSKLIHEYSKPYEGYDPQITDQKIEHFLTSGTRPITCQIIAEKGYKCPRMANGSCSCKSPAALCYKPMSVEGLNSILNTLPVSLDALTNIRTVTAFIKSYLFNQDSTIATTFIRHNVKQHFTITADEKDGLLTKKKTKTTFDNETIKAFVELYKEQNKIYRQGLDVRKSRVGDTTLPEWYEPVGRGLRFMPKVLAKHLKENEQVFFAAEEHYIYSNGVYKHLDEMDALKMVQDKMLDSEAKMSQISDAGQQWKMQVHKEMKELNPNPYIINIKNGLYNVMDGTLKEHSPSYISTVQLNVTKTPDADCPLFKAFLLNAMEGDSDQVKLIQEMLGYFLIPTNAAQKCFVIVGVAAAGKSVLLRVINEILLGKENVSNVAWQALNERFKTAELFGKLANIFSDLPTKNIDDNGIFKALVGEDFLTVEKKNKNPFSFQSYARLLFSCNSIPKNYGDKSEGFYRKLIIIRFNKSIPESERDPELLSKFAMEADGIFNFALEGLTNLIRNKFKFDVTDKNKQELQQYREDSDSILLFVKECCTIGASYQCGSTELYNAYKAFCEESGLKPYAQRTFVTYLKTQYPEIETNRDNGHGPRTLVGIGVLDDEF